MSKGNKITIEQAKLDYKDLINEAIEKNFG